METVGVTYRMVGVAGSGRKKKRMKRGKFGILVWKPRSEKRKKDKKQTKQTSSVLNVVITR